MNKDIITSLRPALVMTILFAILLGLAYPMALTGIGQMLFPAQANGSLIEQDVKVVGSTLIGQGFASDRYRPQLGKILGAQHLTQCHRSSEQILG